MQGFIAFKRDARRSIRPSICKDFQAREDFGPINTSFFSAHLNRFPGLDKFCEARDNGNSQTCLYLRSRAATSGARVILTITPFPKGNSIWSWRRGSPGPADVLRKRQHAVAAVLFQANNLDDMGHVSLEHDSVINYCD